MVDPTGRTARPPVSTGLTEDEAMDFSKGFTLGIVGFIIIALIAHYLVWQWRPWIPGAEGYPVAMDTARMLVAHLV